MFVRNYKDVTPTSFGDGIEKRIVIGPQDGAPNFVMRVFDLAAGKTSPNHSHDWEHEGFVLAGEGALLGEEGEIPMKPGDAFFVPPNQKHCMTNRGKETFRFVCVVPLRGEDVAQQ
ncbi:MAG: cupin domain-containing protein [Chloroflexota bacterium]|nr:cupin domain-containing protein [Chloroflexota bacterium]